MYLHVYLARQQALHCYPTLDHSGLEFSAVPKSGGLVSPAEFASMTGGDIPGPSVVSPGCSPAPMLEPDSAHYVLLYLVLSMFINKAIIF